MISQCLCGVPWVKPCAIQTYAGPEIYSVERAKEGGARQSGTLYGVRLGFDHIRRYKLYWGLDALWAKGALKGSSKDHRIKSTLTDTNIEARFGYTFQSKSWRCASFTPFVGLGYFWENNCFEHPSPLPIHFKNHFSYLPFGFLSQFSLSKNVSVGVNVKIRFLIESKVEASHDPEHEDCTQYYDESLQYRFELPLSYFTCYKKKSLACCFVPFYEYRPYGYRSNYPFDFLETKFNIYGATFKFEYLF
ncbi:MAG: hypothetical protein ACH350_02260 [Parachlamydiaceae bacterium]